MQIKWRVQWVAHRCFVLRLCIPARVRLRTSNRLCWTWAGIKSRDTLHAYFLMVCTNLYAEQRGHVNDACIWNSGCKLLSRLFPLCFVLRGRIEPPLMALHQESSDARTTGFWDSVGLPSRANCVFKLLCFIWPQPPVSLTRMLLVSTETVYRHGYNYNLKIRIQRISCFMSNLR